MKATRIYYEVNGESYPNLMTARAASGKVLPAYPNDETLKLAGIKKVIIEEDVPEASEAEQEKQRVEAMKNERTKAVASLTVTVDGITLEADEKSIGRMTQVVTAERAAGSDLKKTKVEWVLAEGKLQVLTVDQIAKALQIATQARSALWSLPYRDLTITSDMPLPEGAEMHVQVSGVGTV